MVYFILYLLVFVFIVWLLKLGLLKIQKERYKDFWLQNNQQNNLDNQLVYYCLGDSAAQGIGASSPKNSYPMLVKEWLEKQTARPVKLVNLSVSGAKLNDVLENQLPQIYRGEKPHIVTVCVGANDISGYNGESFSNQFKTLVRILPPQSYIADLPSFTGVAKSSEWKVVQANQFVHSALNGTNHHLVKLHDATLNNRGWKYFAADYYHPNSRGYKAWSLAFQIAMAERIPELIQIKN